jgi:hypothetical protein
MQHHISLLLKSIVISTAVLLFFTAPSFKKAGSRLASATGWQCKRAVTIDYHGSKSAGSVIQVRLDNAGFDYTKAKTGGEDIRFSTTAKLEGAGLSYWIEKWNDSGATTIWVKLPAAAQPHTIYIHYGNAAAQHVSDGNSTFLFFDDFESGDYTKKWNNVSIGEVIEKDGMLQLKETDGQDGIISANFEITGNMIIRTLYQRGGADEHWVRAGIGGWNKWLCFGDHTDVAGTGTNYVMLYDSASITSLKTAPLVKAANKKMSGNWRPASYWYDGRSLKGMQDTTTVEWPLQNASSKLSLRTLDNDNWDNFSFITVSAYTGPEPTISIGKEMPAH